MFDIPPRTSADTLLQRRGTSRATWPHSDDWRYTETPFPWERRSGTRSSSNRSQSAPPAPEICPPYQFAHVCEEFFRGGHFPHSVLAAIEKEFNVKIVNEYDLRFWGCTSKEELAANVRKTEQRRDLLTAARAASDETASSLHKRAISSRVRRTQDIVDDRIWEEVYDWRVKVKT